MFKSLLYGILQTNVISELIALWVSYLAFDYVKYKRL